MLMSSAILALALIAPADALRADRQEIRDREARALLELSAKRLAEGKADAGVAIARLVEPPDPIDGPTRVVPLPEVVPAAESPILPPGLDPEDRDRVVALFKGSAADWIALAGRAAEAGRFGLADEALRRTIAREPNHAEARRLLGYKAHQGGWATPFALEMEGLKKVDHPTFGWIDAAWVPKLEQGLLPGKVRPGRPVEWLPADQADALRREIAGGWEITTAHFQIRSNAPLAQAIRFGRKLDAFRDLFLAIMADAIGPNLPLAKRYRGLEVARGAPHQVWYFASQEDYVRYLQPIHGPDVANELGRYDPKTARDKPARSYFFRDDAGQIPDEATLYHEASHQLLFETAGPAGFGQNAGQYWVFEGLGTYFETVQPQADGALLVGGKVGPRFAAARQRLLGGELVPLDKFLAMGRARFDGSGGGDPTLHYVQAEALALTLMQGEGGAHREAFLAYVEEAYRGKFGRGGGGRPLAERLGRSLAEIETGLRAYLKADAAP